MTFIYKIVIFLILSSYVLAENILTMGYREESRPPLIGGRFTNDGIYLELYTKAAKKLGYKLEVIRKPKKRLLYEMKLGIIDFYPGFTFTKQRTELVHFIENGLPGGDIGMSLHELPNITSLNQLSGKKVLIAAGGPYKDKLAHIKNIELKVVPKLSIEKAINLIRLKRGEFYIYNKSSVEFYIKRNQIEDIKIHLDCCGGVKPMYLGFSKFSSKYKEVKNPKYDKNKEVTVDNTPYILDKNSIVYKFSKILLDMKESGETYELYNKYYR